MGLIREDIKAIQELRETATRESFLAITKTQMLKIRNELEDGIAEIKAVAARRDLESSNE